MRFSPNLSRGNGKGPGEFMRRLDRIAGDLNVLLVVIAVGLATLDFTFLLTQKVIERLPPITRMVQGDDAQSPAQSPQITTWPADRR